MKNFFQEFKKFITRGNIVDMAVGVIVGGAFTAIVNGLSNNILKPVINWILAMILGKDSLSQLHTYLIKAYTTDEAGAEVLDLANSIYIDWGSFINAIINFLIIAFVLFCIVKVINKVRDSQNALKAHASEGKLTRDERRAMKKAGVNPRDKAAVAAWYAKAAEEEAAAKAAAAEAARLERLANPTTEDLLKSILEELKKD